MILKRCVQAKNWDKLRNANYVLRFLLEFFTLDDKMYSNLYVSLRLVFPALGHKIFKKNETHQRELFNEAVSKLRDDILREAEEEKDRALKEAEEKAANNLSKAMEDAKAQLVC